MSKDVELMVFRFRLLESVPESSPQEVEVKMLELNTATGTPLPIQVEDFEGLPIFVLGQP